jgi:hypothetical protein
MIFFVLFVPYLLFSLEPIFIVQLLLNIPSDLTSLCSSDYFSSQHNKKYQTINKYLCFNIFKTIFAFGNLTHTAHMPKA